MQTMGEYLAMIEDSDAIKNWKTIEEFKKVKRHYEVLQNEFADNGVLLERVATMMRERPDMIGPAEEGNLTSIASQVSNRMRDWTETKRQVERLENSLQSLGINPKAI